MKKAWYVIIVILLLALGGLAKWFINRSNHPVALTTTNTSPAETVTLSQVCSDCSWIGSNNQGTLGVVSPGHSVVAMPATTAAYQATGRMSFGFSFDANQMWLESADSTLLSIVLPPNDTARKLYTAPPGQGITAQPIWTVDDRNLVVGLGPVGTLRDAPTAGSTSIVLVDVQTGEVTTLLTTGADAPVKTLTQVMPVAVTKNLSGLAHLIIAGWSSTYPTGAYFAYDLAQKQLTKLDVPFTADMKFIRAGDPDGEGDGQQLAGRLLWTAGQQVHFVRLDTFKQFSFTLEDKYLNDLGAVSPSGHYVLYRRSPATGTGSEIVRLDTMSGEKKVIMSGAAGNLARIDDALWTPDETAVLFEHDTGDILQYQVVMDMENTPIVRTVSGQSMASDFQLQRSFYPMTITPTH